MSPNPYRIEAAAPLRAAHDLMREHKIRHLPVMDHGRLVGVISLGDLHLLETLKDIDVDCVCVRDAMTDNPYAVPSGTSLREVAINMCSHKYGSAIVVEGDRVIGLFTAVDAMRVIANILD